MDILKRKMHIFIKTMHFNFDMHCLGSYILLERKMEVRCAFKIALNFVFDDIKPQLCGWRVVYFVYLWLEGCIFCLF